MNVPAKRDSLVTRSLRRVLGTTVERKETLIPGTEAGWRPYRTGPLASTGYYPRRLESFLGTYGGTDDSVSWVYACVSLVQQEQASYPYELVDGRGNVSFTSTAPHDHHGVPDDLLELLDEPNDTMTYFDHVEYRAMDEELTGNSYWLKDARNSLGQPFSLMRLRPEYVQIAVNDAGRIIGFLYRVRNIATPIPYDRDEIIHFKRPNPLDEYYGMGTVEAIQRALNSDLAQTDHIIGFFSDGARISGVLTTNTLSETQFERFKEQFYEEYSGDANAHKILIAEEGTRFDPITQPPAGTGVVELRKMTKDEILSGFGIHEFLLGGAGQSGVYKMEEAQHIFSRRMVPKARRDSERMTRDLTILWGYRYRTNVTYAEPKSVKVERASNMLKGGATINESRHEMDQPPISEAWADLPVIPQGFAPFGMMHPGGAPAPQLALAASATWGPGTKSPINPPPLPEGFEQRGPVVPTAVTREAAMRVLLSQAAVLPAGAGLVARAVRKGFADQRRRVLRRMGFFEDQHTVARLNRERKKRLPKDELTLERVWDEERENEAFTELMTEALGAIANRSVEALEAKQTFDPTSQEVLEVMRSIGELIVGINETTRLRIAEVIAEGVRRGYSVQQIANGFPEEDYPGIMGVFDDATEARAELIARTETARFFNLVTLATYRNENVLRVEVFDGTEFDEACRTANGEIWTIDRAFTNPLEHPNCVRAFAAVTPP